MSIDGALEFISADLLIRQEPPFPFGLAQNGVHEVAPAEYGDTGAATGFMLAAAGAALGHGACLWVVQGARSFQSGLPYGFGLLDFGFNPAQILFVQARALNDALWALEEGLKSGAVALGVAEIEDLSFTASRRLTLASAASGTPAAVLLPHHRDGATAAHARWRVASAPSGPHAYDSRAVGSSRWRAVLQRSRTAPNAVGRAYDLEFDHETTSLRLVPELAARPATPHAQIGQPVRRTG